MTNNPPPGSAASQNFAFSGVLTLNNINEGNGTITNTFTTPTSGSLNMGGVLFTASADTFSPPTINSTSSVGSIGGVVQATAVPEPTCACIIILGLMPMLRRTRRMI